ncbi:MULTISPECIES: Rpp14/Pop5 family protein [Halococcus]|uniref:Ribonuclease P protein component 2 n=1 Tax=Halococcus salifodinae DSM 8989 TaxID=1227456 RepID=M0MWH0_9EURY|nr:MULTISPECIES: Rpp14/Pop5 family protein [Halococcus]EMA50067.1 ribonuclease p protein subunit rpp14 [Halococcus salifodinae DSM 8989]
MKHLPKHLRPRRRYLAIAIEAWPDADPGKHAFQRACWYAAQNLLGDPGAADVDLRVLDFSFADGDGTAIVRVRHGEVERARAAIACVDEISGSPVGVRVLGVSGTVRACEERYIGRASRGAAERNVVFADSQRPAVVRNGRFDVHGEPGFVGATSLDI